MVALRTRNRRSILRKLKAYGLRARGLPYKEIAPHLKRFDPGLFLNLKFRDQPLNVSTVQALAKAGARIVIMHFHRRRRQPPTIAALVQMPRRRGPIA